MKSVYLDQISNTKKKMFPNKIQKMKWSKFWTYKDEKTNVNYPYIEKRSMNNMKK